MQNEIKAKIRSLYYGQKVLYVSKDAIVAQSNNEGMWSYLYSTSYLLLRSVKQLTDEEALNLAYLAQYHPSIEDYTVDEVWVAETESYEDGTFKIEIGCRCWEGKLCFEKDGHIWLENEDDSEYKEFVYNTLACYDYLRSIGIAIPVTLLVDGAVRTIGVEEQILNNIIKIAE